MRILGNKWGIWNIETSFGLMSHPDGDLEALSDDGPDPDDKADDEPDPDDKDDVDDLEDKDDKDDKDDEEDKEDDDKADEEEDKDDDKEDDEDEENESLELTSTVTDIKKEFPEFFKKFPDVKAAMFREQKYSQILGTPEQAEEAVERSEALTALENDLFVKGNPVDLLKTLKKNGGDDVYEKVVTSIIPYLQENDKDLYYKIAAVPIKQLLRAAYKSGGVDAKTGKPNDLAKAALWVHNFFFENTDLDKPVELEGKKQPEKDPEKEDLKKRLASIEDGKARDFGSSVDNSYISRMMSEIKPTLDKDDRLGSDWMKTKLADEIMTRIRQQLDKDTRFSSTMKNLFTQAAKNGYSKDFKSRIVSTALARAKSLVPSVRKEVVAEALGKKKNVDKDRKEKVNNDTRRKETRLETKTPKSRDNTPTKQKTDLDILRAGA